MKCTLVTAEETGVIAIHRGAACDDPACPFRRPILRPRGGHFDGKIAESLRQHARVAAMLLRASLGIGGESKADYVRREGRLAPAPDRPHFCHVPECPEAVAPAYLMCGVHWRLVPRELRAKVFAHYQPGQEKGLREPTADYLEAARAAVEAVQKKLSPTPIPGPGSAPQLSLFGESKQ